MSVVASQEAQCLQEEAVRIMELFHDLSEPFTVSQAKDTIIRIYHDMYHRQGSTLFGPQDCFVLYTLHSILQAAERWHASR